MPVISTGRTTSRRRARWLFSWTLAAATISVSAPAWAEDAPSPGERADALEEQTRRIAKARYEEGVEAYRAGLFELSIEYFRTADRLSPSPALSFNVARAYERLGKPRDAVNAYRSYLARAPDSPHAELAKTRIAALSKETARRAPDAERQGPAVKTALVRAEVTPAEAGARTGAIHAESPAAEAGSGSLGAWPVVALSAGGAAWLGAGVFELLRRDAESDARDARRNPEQSQLDHAELIDRAEARQTAAQVSFGLGAALLVTGGILWLVDERTTREPSTRADVSFAPGEVRAGVTTRF